MQINDQIVSVFFFTFPDLFAIIFIHFHQNEWAEFNGSSIEVKKDRLFSPPRNSYLFDGN